MISKLIFGYKYVDSAYADDTVFFLKGITSTKHMIDTLYFFSFFFRLKPNLIKSLKIWKMANLTLEGKIVIFKTIVTSKIVFQLFITTA